jgi:death-on-curing protein
MLDSALKRPENKWHYECSSISELAAAYAYGISQNHPFIDGNKRTAFLSMAVLLMKNGLRLHASEPDAYSTMIGVAAGALTEAELASWLESSTSSNL